MKKFNIKLLLGELVETLTLAIYKAGRHNITLTASELPSSAYIYRIESDALYTPERG